MYFNIPMIIVFLAQCRSAVRGTFELTLINSYKSTKLQCYCCIKTPPFKFKTSVWSVNIFIKKRRVKRPIKTGTRAILGIMGFLACHMERFNIQKVYCVTANKNHLSAFGNMHVILNQSLSDLCMLWKNIWYEINLRDCPLSQ